MPRCLSGIATNLLLSALVLAWGVVPPAVRHSHEGGADVNHRHEVAAHHGHEHHGHSHDEDWHPGGAKVSASVLRGLVVHLHWSFLGLDFSVPLSDDEQSKDGRQAATPAVVRLVDFAPAPTLDTGHSLSIAPVIVALSSLEAALVQAPSLAGFERRQSAPLCDRARRERSGVLLV